eukprot:g2738.t1
MDAEMKSAERGDVEVEHGERDAKAEGATVVADRDEKNTTNAWYTVDLRDHGDDKQETSAGSRWRDNGEEGDSSKLDKTHRGPTAWDWGTAGDGVTPPAAADTNSDPKATGYWRGGGTRSEHAEPSNPNWKETSPRWRDGGTRDEHAEPSNPNWKETSPRTPRGIREASHQNGGGATGTTWYANSYWNSKEKENEDRHPGAGASTSTWSHWNKEASAGGGSWNNQPGRSYGRWNNYNRDEKLRGSKDSDDFTAWKPEALQSVDTVGSAASASSTSALAAAHSTFSTTTPSPAAGICDQQALLKAKAALEKERGALEKEKKTVKESDASRAARLDKEKQEIQKEREAIKLERQKMEEKKQLMQMRMERESRELKKFLNMI